jgi:hypothetical protein
LEGIALVQVEMAIKIRGLRVKTVRGREREGGRGGESDCFGKRNLMMSKQRKEGGELLQSQAL